MLTSAGYISIVELIVYFPALGTSIYICSRHGWSRATGWIYTLLLSLIRIVGAICQLVTYSSPSRNLIIATFIIDSIGLAPLLFATLGLLSRLADGINANGSKFFNVLHFHAVQIVILVGLILSIVGGTEAIPKNDTDVVKTPTLSKVGVILYFVGFAALTAILVVTTSQLRHVPGQERRIALAVGLAWPFILARLLYSALAVFVHNHLFSLMGGSVAVRAGMAVAEEFVVVIIYLALGLYLKKLAGGELANRPWKLKTMNVGLGRERRRRRRY